MLTPTRKPSTPRQRVADLYDGPYYEEPVSLVILFHPDWTDVTIGPIDEDLSPLTADASNLCKLVEDALNRCRLPRRPAGANARSPKATRGERRLLGPAVGPTVRMRWVTKQKEHSRNAPTGGHAYGFKRPPLLDRNATACSSATPPTMSPSPP